MQNTVRRQFDPTLDEEPLTDFDSTVTPSSGRAEGTGGPPLQSSRSRKPSREYSLGEVIVAIVAAVVVGLMGWAGTVLVGLNREVGEMKSKIERLDHLEQKLDDLDKQLQNEIRERLTTSQPAARPQPRR